MKDIKAKPTKKFIEEQEEKRNKHKILFIYYITW